MKLKLQDQPAQILALLLENAGEVVTREDIQKRRWPEHTYVDFENAINSAIRKLRGALGDTPENPRFVETLAHRGYRFIAPASAAVTISRQVSRALDKLDHVELRISASAVSDEGGPKMKKGRFQRRADHRHPEAARSRPQGSGFGA